MFKKSLVSARHPFILAAGLSAMLLVNSAKADEISRIAEFYRKRLKQRCSDWANLDELYCGAVLKLCLKNIYLDPYLSLTNPPSCQNNFKDCMKEADTEEKRCANAVDKSIERFLEEEYEKAANNGALY